MKKNTKVLLTEAVKVAGAAFIGAITAAFAGCTTVNIPADSGACHSANVGVVNK